jgi:hypothetical protein
VKPPLPELLDRPEDGSSDDDSDDESVPVYMLPSMESGISRG